MDPELGRFVSADPTIQHPYDPQDFNRYAYARNNPVKYIDPNGYGFFSWVKSFFAGFAGAAVAAFLAPVIGPVFAGMLGGAISGAIAGAFDGGLEGALRGALWGAAIGGISGGIFQGLEHMIPGAGYAFAGLAMAGGGVYAGVTGGAEGLANYVAGAAGGFSGATYGSSVANQSLSNSQELESNLSPGAKEELKEALGSADFERIEKTVESINKNPSGSSGNDKAKIISDAARSGTLGKGNNSSGKEVIGEWQETPFIGKSSGRLSAGAVMRIKATLSVDGTLEFYYQRGLTLSVDLPIFGEKGITFPTTFFQKYASIPNYSGSFPDKLDSYSGNLISFFEELIDL